MAERHSPWLNRVLGSLAVVILGFFADLVGILQITWPPFVAFLGLHAPVWLVLLILVVLSVALVFLMRRRRPKPPLRTSVDISVYTEGQFREILHEFLVTAKTVVRVHGLTKEWVFPLMPSLLVARLRDVEIWVSCSDGAHERYSLLENLGCKVNRRMAGDSAVVLRDPGDIRLCQALARCPRKSDGLVGRLYYGSFDWSAVQALNLVATAGFAGTPDTQPFKPELVEVEEERLFEALRKVPLYEGARFAIKKVRPSETLPVTRHILKFKLRQVKFLVELYEQRGWTLFKPCGVKLRNGQISLLVPPVLEVHDGRYCVAEGHSRLHYLRSTGDITVQVVIVEGVTSPPPSKPTSWKAVEEADEKEELGDPRLSRYIETSTHKNIWVP